MDLVIPTYIDTQFSPIMGVVISIGVLCAGVSTLEGLLLALSGILASDLFMPVLRRRLKEQSPERQMKLTLSLARISLLVIGVVTFGLGLHQIKHPTGGSVAIFAQYGIYCLFSAAFAPMLFGMFFKVVPQLAALLAAATAVIVYVGMSLFQISSLHNNPAVLSACAITSSTLVMGLGVLYKKLLINAAKRRVASWGKREPRHVTWGMYK
jgi:sodium/pantothenate symporter